MDEEPIGIVTHFFSKINVAVIKLENAGLKIGDTIRIRGQTTDFEQKVESMQVEHKSVTEAGPGDDFGMQVIEPVRANDKVFKL